MSGAPEFSAEAHVPPPSRQRGAQQPGALPLPPAGGDRGAGTRFKLARPTKLAKQLRADPTEAEKRLWSRLRAARPEGARFNRQLPIAGYICDFVCRSAKLVVKVDGGQHGERSAQDGVRTTMIEEAGYRVVRFWNNEVLANTDGVLAEIGRMLRAGAHPPAPSRKREGERE